MRGFPSERIPSARARIFISHNDFHSRVESATEILKYEVLYELREQFAYKVDGPDPKRRLNSTPRLGLIFIFRLEAALEALREIGALPPVGSDLSAQAAV